MSIAVLLLQIMATIGLGLLGLRVLGVHGAFRPGERPVFAFALGFGLLGWILFVVGVAGLFSPWELVGVLVIGSSGLLLLERKDLLPGGGAWSALSIALLALFAAVVALDLIAALAPPADADSLAYHFETPRLFLEAGRIVLVPRVLDGIAPYLVELTFVPVLALGGERALTLWAAVSGLGAGALLYVICRRHLGRTVSLATLLVFVTTPAVIYEVGAGQVEVRAAMFVLLGTWAAAEAHRTGRLGFVALAGVAAGFYVGAKYIGLLFVPALGICVLGRRQWFRHGVVFGIAALIAGGQWYGWNAIHTGDPVFPMAFQWLGRDDLTFWTKQQDLAFKAWFFDVERAVPRNLFWLFGYPFKATLFPSSAFESDRIGFGPYGLLLLPLAVLGTWAFRDRLPRTPLVVYALSAGIFYVLWFFTGSSQRVRHLLPVLPLLLVCFTVAGVRVAETQRFRGPLVAVFAFTIAVQLTAQGLFSVKYVRYALTGFDRAAFLEASISGYAPVPWINAHLGPTDRVLIRDRQLLYYLTVPYFFGTPMGQTQLDLRPEQMDGNRLYDRLRAAGVNYLLLPSEGGVHDAPYNRLDVAQCVDVVHRFETHRMASRTLPGLGAGAVEVDLVRLKPDGCDRTP